MNQAYARLDEVYDDEISSRSPSRQESTGDTQTDTDNETYIIGRSRSPSILSGISSPISSLDTDDYDSDRGSPVPHEFREPERVPEPITQSPLRNIRTTNVSLSQSNSGNEEVMKQILRIQKDLKKITIQDQDESPTSIPFVEIGLFVSVGLFVLLSMNMMLQMGKQHVTYRFSSFD